MVLRRLGEEEGYTCSLRNRKMTNIAIQLGLPSFKLNARAVPPKNAVSLLSLIATGASTTSTMHTLHHRPLVQFCLWHTTYTRRPKVRFFRLNAFQATQFLVSLFLPSCDQCCVCVILLQQPLVQLCRDGFAGVVEIIDIP